MSIRLAILAAIDEGAVTSGEIIGKLAINGRSFHNSIRFMINQGWLLSSSETGLVTIVLGNRSKSFYRVYDHDFGSGKVG